MLINNCIIETGKYLPDKLVKIKSNIDNLNKTYTKISEIIDERLGSCYSNNVENLTESIFHKILHWAMQANNYCKDLLKTNYKIQ